MRRMRNQDPFGRGVAGIPVAILGVILASSCGGGGTAPPALQCSSSEPVANEVVLACAGKVDSTTELVEVVVGGPTGVSNIEGFNFDIVFDSTKVVFVDGSAAQGTLLDQGGVTPLLAAEASSGDPGRVVVGIHRGGPSGGVGGIDPQNLVLRLSFRLVGTQTVGPLPLRFENAEAVSPTGAKIGGIIFKDGLSLSYS